MSRSSPSRIIGFLAIVLSLATFILAVVLAIYLTIGHRRLYILALAAAITQVVPTFTLPYLLVKYGRHETRNGLHRRQVRRDRRGLYILALGIIPSTVAGVVVGTTLGCSKASNLQGPRHILGLKTASFLLVALVVWSVAVIAQITFYVCLAFSGVAKRSPEPPHTIDESQALQEMAEPIRPETSTTDQFAHFHEAPVSTSYPPSVSASEESNSLRSSLSTMQRPINSKTRLLIRQHSFPRPSKKSMDSPSQERVSQDSGFDSWDTSEVAPHIRETVLQSSPTLRGKPLKPLEPIPGSRSPSPAKALEGPFFPQPESLSPPPSPLPQPSFSRPTSRQRSASSEDHIHPLFRTCSPTPPPTASSGTTLTAAPLAGQLINGHALRRMRSGSLPSSTSPPVRSNSFDQSGARASAVLPSHVAPPPTPELTIPGTYPTSPTGSVTPTSPTVPHQPGYPTNSTSSVTPTSPTVPHQPGPGSKPIN
ncbi:hypothetical protein MMC07_004678 [Pseudocyphellaria aurata]|nr:hypothetical protein [Pseudocyphellaria aurata]